MRIIATARFFAERLAPETAGLRQAIVEGAEALLVIRPGAAFGRSMTEGVRIESDGAVQAAALRPVGEEERHHRRDV